MAHEPKKPDTPEPKTDASKIGHTQHGIPPDAMQEEPMGLPDSDRHHSEIAPAKT